MLARCRGGCTLLASDPLAKKRKSEPEYNPYALLTLADAARIANVTTATMREWIRDGRLKSVPMPASSRRRVKRGTLDAFLERHDCRL
ncbi:MAG: helix-turn-helix domain-containing protein [Planctomycetales bacterium]|nr:helix-turn-helix domain-containing protein [Planctomycetales bacterium]